MRFSQQHEQLRDTVIRFVENEIDPYVDEWEAAGIFPARELFPKLGALGLLGLTKPEPFGGLGLDYSYEVVFAEALGAARCGGVPMAIGVQTDMATPALARFGSDELREQFLRPAIAGTQVAAIAVSEPHAGSDVAAIRTRARRNGDDYIVDGTKMWITNSTQADFFCVLANTSDRAPHRNKSLIVVPADRPGISFSKPLAKLGMRSSDTAQVFFDKVRVPVHYRIGDEGQGFAMQMMQFQEERLYAAASGLKALDGCIDATIDYCRERRAFGQSVLDNQSVHFKLAELSTEIEALRALVYQAVEGYIHGEDVTRLASMAKLKSGRLCREVTDSCLQFWGAMGFMWDNPVSRAYRDFRLMSIGGGSDEMMLGIIAKSMGTLPHRG